MLLTRIILRQYLFFSSPKYFWNFSEPEASAYYISSVLEAINNPYVEGTFTDDVTGLPAEHDLAPARMKLSNADVQALQRATSVTNGLLIDAAVSAGKYVWAAFGDQDGVSGGPSQANCASWMRSRCTPDWQTRATTQNFDSNNANQSIASFLVVRPPIGFLGKGWESDMKDWREEFLWQVGEPSTGCAEGPTGVFSRQWTYGKVVMDCNKWTATIPTA